MAHSEDEPPTLTDPFQESHSNGESEKYMNISCMPAYQDFSVEELRLSNSQSRINFVDDAEDTNERVTNGGPFKSVWKDIVTVEVGLEKTEFRVHEHLLSETSDFFRTLIQRSGSESSSGSVELPDHDPITFNIFVDWLYQQHMPLQSSRNSSITEVMVKSYVLGDKLQSADFKDISIDVIISNLVGKLDGNYHIPTMASIDCCFSRTTAGDPLRRLFVDFWTETGSSAWFAERADDVHKDFLCDLSAKLLDRLAIDSKRHLSDITTEPCKYHSHGTKPCYRTRDKPWNNQAKALAESLKRS